MLPVVLAHFSSVLKALAVEDPAGGEYLFYHAFGIFIDLSVVAIPLPTAVPVASLPMASVTASTSQPHSTRLSRMDVPTRRTEDNGTGMLKQVSSGLGILLSSSPRRLPSWLRPEVSRVSWLGLSLSTAMTGATLRLCSRVLIASTLKISVSLDSFALVPFL
jgi:hypothetical protein